MDWTPPGAHMDPSGLGFAGLGEAGRPCPGHPRDPRRAWGLPADPAPPAPAPAGAVLSAVRRAAADPSSAAADAVFSCIGQLAQVPVTRGTTFELAEVLSSLGERGRGVTLPKRRLWPPARP